jgi:hypothetical protein
MGVGDGATPGTTNMALRISSFEIEIHLGYLSIRAGKAWDLYWNHLHRDFVVCRGDETVWSYWR